MNEANPNAELVTSLEGYAMSSAVVVDGKVYFIDAWQIKNSLPTQASTGKIFCLDITLLRLPKSIKQNRTKKRKRLRICEASFGAGRRT